MINAKEALELSEACFMKMLKEDFEKQLPELEASIKAACETGARGVKFTTNRYSKPYLESLGYEVNENGSIYW